MVALSLGGAATLSAQTREMPIDTFKVDTLREVVVKADSGIHLPLSNSLKSDLKLQNWADKYSLNGIIQRKLPTLHDQIMHPFGFKERKKNRKRKKVQKVLEQYDAIDYDPLQILLDSVARAQGLEPRHK